MSESIPWAHWLRLAMALGVAPHHFWRLSLREWRALLGADSADILPRGAFDALHRDYPDQETLSHE